jgi:hypothetical protein
LKRLQLLPALGLLQLARDVVGRDVRACSATAERGVGGGSVEVAEGGSAAESCASVSKYEERKERTAEEEEREGKRKEAKWRRESEREDSDVPGVSSALLPGKLTCPFECGWGRMPNCSPLFFCCCSISSAVDMVAVAPLGGCAEDGDGQGREEEGDGWTRGEGRVSTFDGEEEGVATVPSTVFPEACFTRSK